MATNLTPLRYGKYHCQSGYLIALICFCLRGSVSQAPEFFLRDWHVDTRDVELRQRVEDRVGDWPTPNFAMIVPFVLTVRDDLCQELRINRRRSPRYSDYFIEVPPRDTPAFVRAHELVLGLGEMWRSR